MDEELGNGLNEDAGRRGLFNVRSILAGCSEDTKAGVIDEGY